MDTDQENSIEESVAAVVESLPQPVRAFIARGDARMVAAKIRGKYQLHIDAAAVVEKEILLLIVGLETPQQFAIELAQEAHLDTGTIDHIVNDLNFQVFAPLQQEIRMLAQIKPESAPGQAFQRPQQLPRPVASVPDYASSAPRLTPAEADRPMPQASVAVPEQRMSPQLRPATAALPPKATMPGGLPATPSPAPLPRPTPPVPQNLPGTMPAQDVMPEGAFPRTYLVDPYRESPE